MDARDIRIALHQIPELGRREYETKKYILNIATKLNCKIFEPTETSIVLYFNLNYPTTLCFRSDMDGLPILEATNLSYKSKHEGIMHACGHDGHMAMLLSFAIWASNNLNLLKHNIVCLFQPSEEDDCGANDIIKSNILDELKINAIFGFHIWPTLEEGKLYSMPNGMLASSGEVTIEINGEQFHAANRKENDDAILRSFKLINDFYNFSDTISSPHLINFGKIIAGSARNIVPGNSHIEATLRAFDDDTFKLLSSTLINMSKNLEDDKFKINTKINWSYPSVLNDSSLFNHYKSILNLNELEKPFLQAEDFGCYTRKYKSLFMLLGAGDTNLLHTNKFDFNMDILQTGVEAYKKLSMIEFINK